MRGEAQRDETLLLLEPQCVQECAKTVLQANPYEVHDALSQHARVAGKQSFLRLIFL
jgi:hypothetical protein